jgi:hypothetical protein
VRFTFTANSAVNVNLAGHTRQDRRARVTGRLRR